MVIVIIVFQFAQVFGEAVRCALHDIKHILSIQIIPWGGDDSRIWVQLTDDFCIRLKLCLVHILGFGKNDAGCSCDLIVKEFLEIPVIHFAASCVDHSAVAVQFNPADCFHCPQDIGKLSDPGRLNDDPVRMIGIDDLLQRLLKITFQGAADAAAVYLADLNAGLLQESSVNADFAEFIFYKDYLLAMENIFDQL